MWTIFEWRPTVFSESGKIAQVPSPLTQKDIWNIRKWGMSSIRVISEEQFKGPYTFLEHVLKKNYIKSNLSFIYTYSISVCLSNHALSFPFTLFILKHEWKVKFTWICTHIYKKFTASKISRKTLLNIFFKSKPYKLVPAITKKWA